MMPLSVQDSVSLFRHSAPYINAHRGKTFVLLLSGEAIDNGNIANIVHDIALLNSLGVRLVLVHGARAQYEQRCNGFKDKERFEKGIRISDKASIKLMMEVVGAVRAKIEALLTMGLANSPMQGSKIRVCSGNLVIAQPLGIHDGVDFEYTGKVRRVDVPGIRDHLDDGSIVLLSPLGYSTTGEVFNLACEEVATQAAIALKADKLVFFSREKGLLSEQGTLLRSLERSSLVALLEQNQSHGQQRLLNSVATSLDAGVDRCHCVSFQEDGALLQELFTREGAGTLISQQHYEQLRQATIEDVGGILSLIKPLEEQGVLVKRSRDLLEAEISYFWVIERDGMIVACAALYPYLEEQTGELACVATHPEYRGKARGERLLSTIKSHAKEIGLSQLFVLTTVTAHWFREQGFMPSELSNLPACKQQLYNLQRQSKAYNLAL